MDKIAMDMTIRLGDILTMVGLLGGGILVIIMMRADMKILARNVESIEGRFGAFASVVEEKFNGITSILVEQAKHDERLNNVENRLREMMGPATARNRTRGE